MLRVRKTAFVFLVGATLACYSTVPARAQGCIVARSGSMDMSPQSQGGYLEKGDWDLTIGYRHQFSTSISSATWSRFSACSRATKS